MTTLLMLAGLLLVTLIVVALGEKIHLPWPVLLVLVTALSVFIPGLPRINIPSELILPVFLPPLLWALARRTSWAAVRSSLSSILSLSVMLVFITIAAVAGTALWLMPGIGVAGAIVIGAAIAPPDPVAVDAVAEPVGIPKRITGVLQTEGLFNDAASIVAFHIALAAAMGHGDLSWTVGISQFAWSVVGAIILGLIVGRLGAWFTNHVDSATARNALTWLLPFAVYIIAEEVAASGVIAIVIAAVEMSSRSSVGAEDRLSGQAFWSTVELLFTGVAFGLIGITVRDAVAQSGSALWHAVYVGVILAVVAIVVRFAWLYALYWVNTRRRRQFTAPLRLQEVLLMTWAGMRGLVTLALVLSIPATASWELHREVVVIAMMVLLVTMVLPGLTLPTLMKKLDLSSGPDAAGDEEMEELRHRAWQASRAYLLRATSTMPDSVRERLHRLMESQIREETEEDEEEAARMQRYRAAFNELRLESLKVAQAELLMARSERGVNPVIVDEVLRNIDRLIMTVPRD